MQMWYSVPVVVWRSAAECNFPQNGFAFCPEVEGGIRILSSLPMSMDTAWARLSVVDGIVPL
jgi:hypothetical protein